MHRRHLLTRLAALSGSLGVAGCAGNASTDSTDQTADTDPTPQEREYRLTDLTVSTSTDRPSVKYVLEPSAFYSGEAVEREEERTGKELLVKHVSEIDDDEVREAIETACRTGDWRSNTLPDGLAETVERVDFFTGVSEDETYTHIGLTLYRLHPDDPPPLKFSATISDDRVEAGSPGALELTLTNTSSRIQTIFSGAIPPFSMLTANPVGKGRRFLLWYEDYDEDDCVHLMEDSWMRCDVGVQTKIRPDQSISRRYELLSWTTQRPEYTVPPGPNTYRVTDTVSYYEGAGAPESKLSIEIEFTLEAVE